jgi:hypothetical protein
MKKMIGGMLAVVLAFGAPAHATQNDAGSGGDAGNTFETATPVQIGTSYLGTMDVTDREDYYAFFLPEGASASVLVTGNFGTGQLAQLFDPDAIVADTATGVTGFGVAQSGAWTSEVGALRLVVHRARISGYYRMRLTTDRAVTYTFCIMNCETPRDDPTEFIFGGSLKRTRTRVLLVPPTHGDLGNPLGPTVKDYLDTTLRGIHRWTAAMDAFATDYPEYDYLRDITIEVEIFDGADPVDPAGYEVILVYVAAGPAFRGVAADVGDDPEEIARWAGVNTVNYTGRYIALSLFGSAPRAGQVAYDFPELNDLEIVTLHEFGHTFGLGHTRTITAEYGHDLMNSPASFVYGDGSPVGDGGERTPMQCLSSLNLWGMAHLYRWIPSGRWQGTRGTGDLPPGMGYVWYC